jgi:two-component sensor histidine kinase
MIIDGLGLISVMNDISNYILYATVLEALLLSLAFTDKYVLLQEQKEKSDQLLVQSLENQQIIIKEEIRKQTQELSNALESKKVLLKELHHRTKNNIQLILSIVRIEATNLPNTLHRHFNDLIHRILAIAKTHEMLYLKENLQEINMIDYIYELCDQLEHSVPKDIIFDIQINDISLPLTEASYVGLILNEIIINSVKHAKCTSLKINIKMERIADECVIYINDNGEEDETKLQNSTTLGMSIISSLVENQLEGSINKKFLNGTHYTIRFTL